MIAASGGRTAVRPDQAFRVANVGPATMHATRLQSACAVVGYPRTFPGVTSNPLAVGAQVTPRWLEDRLRDAGALTRGHVAAMSTQDNDAFNSSVIHLRVDYDADVDAPRALVLKRMTSGHGELEVAFYRRVEPALRSGCVPRCVDAAFDSRSGDSHLLLVDASSTHAPLVTRADLLAGIGVPSARRLRAVGRTLAAIHAGSWEHPAVGREPPFELRPWFSDATAFEAHIDRRHRELDQARPHLGASALADFRRDLAALPDIWTGELEGRLAGGRQLTVVQGDCYLTQWLGHRTDEDDAVLVDFDSACAAPPTFDLVFLLATFWSREVRSTAEPHVLRSYHEALLELGVQDYSWSALLEDYRTMLALVRFDVVFDIANGSRPGYWQPKLTCLADAWADWRDGTPRSLA